MKRRFLSLAVIAAMLIAAPSCSDDDDDPTTEQQEQTGSDDSGDKSDDNKSDDNKSDSEQENTDDGDNTQEEAKVTVTLPDGSTQQVTKDSEFTLPEQESQFGKTVYTINGQEYEPGQTISVSEDVTVTKTDYYSVTITTAAGTTTDYAEAGKPYTLPACEEAQKAYFYTVAGTTLRQGKQIEVAGNIELTAEAMYSIKASELQAFIADKDEVTVELSDYDGTQSIFCTDMMSGKSVSLVLPDGLTGIPDYAFGNCGSLVSVSIPSTIQSIGTSAFGQCTSLKSIEVIGSADNGLTIGNGAFMASGIEKAVFKNVTSVGKSAFYNCTSLESAQIDGLEGTGVSFSGYDFALDTKLGSLVINNAKTINPSIIFNSTNVKSLEINGDATTGVSIGSTALNGSKIVSLKITNALSIAASAISSCTALQTLEIDGVSDGVTIGSYAFGGCGMVQLKVTNAKDIQTAAFQACSNLQVANISGVSAGVAIGASVFAGDGSLGMVVVSNAASFANKTFTSCSSLEEVYINSGSPTFESDTFDNCPSGLVIYVTKDFYDSYSGDYKSQMTVRGGSSKK